ncbi:endonuclease III family 1 protein [Cardiosporidium cionae]|uniref:Endonuclease III homolog n=1 Tax=Cardiosporidium cionae TaxID=476202 RepID=A0ABQ7JAY2_9APIC|nr:endonuclease III family 1 protein [Cardiosporidium cionae]|eukprot:KAF8821165.1 endonuclease III family 1 protein [Cardiosporidium cionae]
MAIQQLSDICSYRTKLRANTPAESLQYNNSKRSKNENASIHVTKKLNTVYSDSGDSIITKAPKILKRRAYISSLRPSITPLNDIEDLQPQHLKTPNNVLPKHFYDVWDGIKIMRAERSAPVDTMGAECLGDEAAPRNVWRFHKLVAALLSSQTKDEAVADCVHRLLAHGLTVPNILKTSEEQLKELLYGVGFHNNKAKFLKKICEILQKEYDEDIPSDYPSLVALPGIGPKMAHIILSVAWNKTEGIAVDVHVHRITNRLGWVKTTSPEKTEEALEKFLPRPLWREINLLLVGFGQQRCRPISPECSGCLAREWCPVGRKSTRTQS